MPPEEMRLSRTIVVGAGVIGMLTSLLLADEGHEVLVLEQVQPGKQSSWAGGGIVSPLYPWRSCAALQRLAKHSQEGYLRWVEHLLARTGVDAEFSLTGLYWLDMEDGSEALAWAALEQRRLYELEIDHVKSAIPAVGLGYHRALYMPDVGNVRNPRLLRALQVALRGLPNVELREMCSVVGFLHGSGRVRGVVTDAGPVLAEQVVVAAGAWSGQLLAGVGLQLPVEPVKGQMILYKCEADFLPAMVLAEGRYAIPRRDGHVLVGSTLEHVGFDKVPTAQALASLRASAEQMLPGLAGREVVGHWAGLRPGSPEGVPFIGEVPELPGLWLNCGHYRNGLVLAPASCELLKNLLLGEAPIVDPAAYSPAGRLGTR